MIRRVGGPTDRTDTWMDGFADRQTDGLVDEWMDGWMYGKADRRMHEIMYGRTDRSLYYEVGCFPFNNVQLVGCIPYLRFNKISENLKQRGGRTQDFIEYFICHFRVMPTETGVKI